MNRLAKAIVHCRVCGLEFDRNDKNLTEGVDWVKPANRVYYHKACYDEYKANKDNVHSKMSDDAWFEATWEFLTKDLKAPVDYKKIRSQWNNFLKKKMTAKGIYFAVKYFYGVKGNDASKNEGGIGIVPHVYEDSRNYWQDREQRETGIIAAIEKQILEAANQNVVQVKINKKKKKTINAADSLAAIVGMEEDE